MAKTGKPTQWNITASDVKADLTSGKGRPQWILSTYGAGKNPSASLFDGNEFSFEELRVRFYELRAAGNEAQAQQEAGSLWSKAEQMIADVAAHTDKVVSFLDDEEKKRPNRNDLLKMTGKVSRDQYAKEFESSKPFAARGSSPFGGTASTGSPFGQTQSTFGRPALGQSTAAPAFGQPGAGFGKPSLPGAQPSAFGATAFGKPAVQGAFGQPLQSGPAFGQPSQPAPAFGQPTQAAAAFGQSSLVQASRASPFGQAVAKPSPFGAAQPAFGQPSQQTAGFGQPSQPGTGFGQSAQTASQFGQTAKPSPFGQPSQNGNANQAVPAFGQPTTALAAPKPQQPTPFGAPPQADSPFSKPAQPAAATPFGTPAQDAAATAPPAPFSSPLQVTTTQSSTPDLNPLTNKPRVPSHYTQTLPPGPVRYDAGSGSKRLLAFKGLQVTYLNGEPCYQRPDGRGMERIWFPDGPETVKMSDVQMEDSVYTDEVKESWRYFAETGGFENGKMPRVPPSRDLTAFDF